jgi:hypothetical protein
MSVMEISIGDYMSENATATIIRLANQEVIEEIQYRMDLAVEDGNDDEYSFEDAFVDTWHWADFQEGMSKQFKDNLKEIAIALGHYRVITQDELDRTISTGKKYAFKFKGEKYVYDRSKD